MGLFQQPARQDGPLSELEADGSDLAGEGSFSRGFGTRLRAGPTLPAREFWRAEKALMTMSPASSWPEGPQSQQGEAKHEEERKRGQGLKQDLLPGN